MLAGTPMDGPKIVADPNTGTLYVNSSTALGPLSTGNPDAPRGSLSTRWIASSKDGVHWTKPQPSGGQSERYLQLINVVCGGVQDERAEKATLFGDANDAGFAADAPEALPRL